MKGHDDETETDCGRLYPAAAALPAMTSGGGRGAAGERRRPGVGM